MELLRLWQRARRIRVAIAAALIAGVAVALFISLVVMKSRYAASAAVVWEPADSEAASGQKRKMATLYHAIQLPSVMEATASRPDVPVRAGGVRGAIRVRNEPGANMLIIRATTGDGASSVAIANGVAEEFIANEERRLRDFHQTIIAQTRALRDTALAELRGARKAYDAFRDENGILDLDAERQVAIQAMAMLSATQGEANAEVEAQNERLRILSDAKGRLDERTVLSEKELLPTAVSLAESEAELQKALSTLTGAHTQVQALTAQVDSLRKATDTLNLAVVAERIVGRHPQFDHLLNNLTEARADSGAANERQQVFSALVGAARERLENLLRTEGQARELQAVLDLRNTHYTEAQATLARAEDTARTATTHLRLASRATPSSMPVSSWRRIAMVMLLPLLFASICLLLGIFLWPPLYRAHSARELSFWGSGPVVATSSWPAPAGDGGPSSERALADLCSDLAPFVATARGTVLIVPFSNAEAKEAEQLATTLNARRGSAPTADEGALQDESDDQHASHHAESEDDGANPTVPLVVAYRPPVTSLPEEGSPEKSQSEKGQAKPVRSADITWRGHDADDLRRACRRADRVLVLTHSRRYRLWQLWSSNRLFGRQRGFAFVLLSADAGIVHLPDRAGQFQGWIAPHAS